MKYRIPYILLLLLICIIGLFVTNKIKEGFQGGALIQLQTSHVPTLEELHDEQLWMRRRVQEEQAILDSGRQAIDSASRSLLYVQQTLQLPHLPYD